MARAMSGFQFGDMLVKAGVITQERLDKTSRIVIGANYDSTVMIYTQEYGDDKALEKLAPMLKGMFDG